MNCIPTKEPWLLYKFSLTAPQEMLRKQWEEYASVKSSVERTSYKPSTMLTFAMNGLLGFSAPLKTIKLAPVTKENQKKLELHQKNTPYILEPVTLGAFSTCFSMYLSWLDSVCWWLEFYSLVHSAYRPDVSLLLSWSWLQEPWHAHQWHWESLPPDERIKDVYFLKDYQVLSLHDFG